MALSYLRFSMYSVSCSKGGAAEPHLIQHLDFDPIGKERGGLLPKTSSDRVEIELPSTIDAENAGVRTH